MLKGGDRSNDRWSQVVDPATGQPARLVPRGLRSEWAGDLSRESTAHQIMQAAIPFAVPILRVGPGITYAEPPASARWPALALADAADCALAACEVTVRVRALGAVPKDTLCFGPGNLRVFERDGRWSIAWIVPARFDLDPPDSRPAFPEGDDARRLAAFFFALAGPFRWRWPWARPSPEIADLRALREGKVRLDVPDLARLLLRLAGSQDAWARRIAAWPTARPARLPFDWDFIIAQGEADINRQYWDEHITLPLAAAYHQRACRSFACGDPSSALRDVERSLALDTFLPYRTTRAVVLDRLGRAAEARERIAVALAEAPAVADPGRRGPWTLNRTEDPVAATEHARAHATAGLFALRDGHLEAAEQALRRAFSLAPTATYAVTLAAVLYRRGDIAGAAELEARAVALDPDDARHRWALLVSLHALGRVDEAREHARELRRRGAHTYEDRIARLIGPAPS